MRGPLGKVVEAVQLFGEPLCATLCLRFSCVSVASAPGASECADVIQVLSFLVIVSSIAVVNATVIPMDRERAIPHQTVLIRGDRIVAIGSTSEISVPDGTLVIDGNGRYLLPGLTDAHVHLSTNLPWAPARPGFGDGPLYLANGVTTVINLGGSPEQLDWRRRVEAGELMGPTIYTSGEFVNEPRMATPAQIEEGVRAQKNDGYDLVKFRERPNTTTGLTLAAYRRMIEVANEVQLPLVGHGPVNLGLDAMLDAHQSLAHVNMLSNVYFMPLASRTGTLLVSLTSFAGVLAAAIGLALCAWRYRRPEQRPFTLRALRRTSSLVGGGITAAVILTLVLPGGPASESEALRWLLTITAVVMALGPVVVSTVLWRTWSGTPGAVRALSVVAVGCSAALAGVLMLFWVPVAWRSSDAGLTAVAMRLRDARITVQSTLVVYDSLGGATRAEILSDPAIAPVASHSATLVEDVAKRYSRLLLARIHSAFNGSPASGRCTDHRRHGRHGNGGHRPRFLYSP